MDIDGADVKNLSLAEFDTVVLGSSIYIGGISKKMQGFCNKNITVLCEKRIGIFLCCGFGAQWEDYLIKNFPATLLQQSVVAKNFGGQARMERMGSFDRFIMKVATKGSYEDIKISEEAMADFLKKINGTV